MKILSITIIVVLSIIAFFHITIIFEKLRSHEEGDFTVGLFLIPVVALYPLAFRFLNDKINKKED
jgi:hypothetical protein